MVSLSWEVQKEHLRCVLSVLKDAGLTAKREKCVFGKKLEFLGHMIGEDVIFVPEARVRVIRNHLVPVYVIAFDTPGYFFNKSDLLNPLNRTCIWNI